MQKGKIGVSTENIFPIIKKFLYSDHEIFLRELISNAVDATLKLKTLASLGEFKGDLGDQTIHVSLDTRKKILTVSDRGLGMTAEEIDKYINQIALSSAEEFLDKYKSAGNNLIGHFGLGFYSVFMVAKKVELITRSYRENAVPVKWECDGSPEYTIVEAERENIGTDVILYFDDDSSEFAEKHRIEGILNKYCRFLPVEIAFGKETEWKDGKQVETDKNHIINDTKPLWTRKPSDLKDEDYEKFYNQLYPMAENPLFNIHLNVDYPFHLTGVLYFPKIKTNFEIQKNKIQLYCNQVFVTDSVEGIVPEFLTLLHGVLDSPDIPLNVSRSYLQSDSNVKKISSHITKKVADRLEEIFKNDREQFEKKWDDLKLFIEYGMITDEKFYERAEKFALLKNTDGKFFTFEEYEKLIKAEQRDKDKILVYLYATDKEEQYTYIDNAKNKGYDVLLLDGQLDPHFINHLETKFKSSRFTRVDGDIIDKLINKEKSKEISLNDDDKEDMRTVFESQVGNAKHFMVNFEALTETDQPILITQSEYMRRMKDMSAIGGASAFYGHFPDSYTMVVNTEHPLIKKLVEDKNKKLSQKTDKIFEAMKPIQQSIDKLRETRKGKKEEEIPQEEKDSLKNFEDQLKALKDKRKEVLTDWSSKNKLVKQLVDLALLANNMLKGEDLARFVKRSVELIK